jgi:aerobic-type carbon monoxide dehydrogenase small subunit (CoxS/CutS family)
VSEFFLTINGSRRKVDVDDDTPLLWILRDNLTLPGTKYGCGIGVCGACTVLEAGKAVRSCQIPAAEAKNRSFTTIEGLSPDANHPCQRAWLEENVAQCGFCQPGMILTACALLRAKKSPTDADIEAALGENVCRCGTYPRIKKAVHRAATLMQGGAK